MPTCIALLRGINVGGHNKVPMAELRSLCTELGWGEVRSYIQSGNVVFTSSKSPAELESELEKAIEGHFRISIPVVVRDAVAWSEYVGANPFPQESATEPNLVMLGLSKKPPNPDAISGLRDRADNGERIERVGDAIWIYFKGGSARSKLSPALSDRLVGSRVTTRNWRTVLKLQDLVGQV